MSAPASEDLRELERELLIASEQGETRSTAALRERFGLGHDDVMSVLDVLREHGKAVEAAPGEWRGPMLDEIDAAVALEPVRVRVAEQSEEPARPAARARPAMSSVRLTAAMVDALDDEALGKLVRAGVMGADGVFALEVE